MCWVEKRKRRRRFVGDSEGFGQSNYKEQAASKYEERKVSMRWGQELGVGGHAKFEMPIRWPSGGFKETAVRSMDFSKEGQIERSPFEDKGLSSGASSVWEGGEEKPALTASPASSSWRAELVLSPERVLSGASVSLQGPGKAQMGSLAGKEHSLGKTETN